MKISCGWASLESNEFLRVFTPALNDRTSSMPSRPMSVTIRPNGCEKPVTSLKSNGASWERRESNPRRAVKSRLLDLRATLPQIVRVGPYRVERSSFAPRLQRESPSEDEPRALAFHEQEQSPEERRSCLASGPRLVRAPERGTRPRRANCGRVEAAFSSRAIHPPSAQ